MVTQRGDGANDAAAIRLADVGIGVAGKSSTAARSAADLVLADPDPLRIVDALTEGRLLWSRVRDAVSILVGGNAGEVAFTVLGTAFGGRAPLNTRQLPLVNMLTDMLPALAVAELVRHQHQAALPGPGHAHVLQFGLRLGIVVAGDNEQPRDRLAGLRGEIAVRRHDEPRPVLENDVLHNESVSRAAFLDEQLDAPLLPRKVGRRGLGGGGFEQPPDGRGRGGIGPELARRLDDRVRLMNGLTRCGLMRVRRTSRLIYVICCAPRA